MKDLIRVRPVNPILERSICYDLASLHFFEDGTAQREVPGACGWCIIGGRLAYVHLSADKGNDEFLLLTEGLSISIGKGDGRVF